MSVVSSINQALMVDEGYSHPVSWTGDEYRAISQVTNEGRTKILTLVELQHVGHVSLEMSLNSLLLNGLKRTRWGWNLTNPVKIDFEHEE